jgi:phosphotransferase system HPr (HPr) family protein
MSDSAVPRIVVMANRAGMHVRVAAMIVTAARRFDAKVLIRKGNHQVEATDIFQVLSLGAAQGEQLSLEAAGQEAPQALDAIEQLFIQKFDED